MSIDIPTATLRELVQHPDELQREIILAMYEARELTGGKAREMLGLTVFAWDGLRKERGLRGAYGETEFAQDVDSFKKLGWL